MKLDSKLIKLISYFLKEYSKKLCDESCNDLDQNEYELFTKLFTKEELHALEKEFQINNGTPDDFDPNHLTVLMYNWAFPSFLSDKLKALP